MTTKVLLNYKYHLTPKFMVEFYKTFRKSDFMYNVFALYNLEVEERSEQRMAELKKQTKKHRILSPYVFFFDRTICDLNDELRMIEVSCHSTHDTSYKHKIIHNKITNMYHNPYMAIDRIIDEDMKKIIEIIEKVGIKNAFDVSEECSTRPQIIEFNPNYDHTITTTDNGPQYFHQSIPYKRILNEIANKDTVALCSMHPFTRQIINKEKTIDDIETDMQQICVNSA